MMKRCRRLFSRMMPSPSSAALYCGASLHTDSFRGPVPQPLSTQRRHRRREGGPSLSSSLKKLRLISSQGTEGIKIITLLEEQKVKDGARPPAASNGHAAHVDGDISFFNEHFGHPAVDACFGIMSDGVSDSSTEPDTAEITSPSGRSISPSDAKVTVCQEVHCRSRSFVCSGKQLLSSEEVGSPFHSPNAVTGSQAHLTNTLFRSVPLCEIVHRDSRRPCFDFASSIVDMIVTHDMKDGTQLEDLYRCYLQLNAPVHHSTITVAFLLSMIVLELVP